MNTRESYWKFTLIALIILMGVLIFRELSPFLGGFLGAITIYTLVRKQMFYLTLRKKIGPNLAATAITVEVVLCFLVPMALVVWLVVGKMKDINLDPQSIIAPLEEAVRIVKQHTGYDLFGKETIAWAMSALPKVGQYVMESLGSFAVNVGVMVIVLFFMLLGGRNMERYVMALLPFNEKNRNSISREVTSIIKSNAIGIPLLAVIQGGLSMLGYWIFDAPNVLFSGLLTCIATLIPMVGTAFVWMPLAAYMALTGHWWNAIGLAAYGIIVISQSDNLIRFIIQKKMADIHPLITIFGVVVGLPLFGFMGIIFGPLMLSLFLVCADLFNKEYIMKK